MPDCSIDIGGIAHDDTNNFLREVINIIVSYDPKSPFPLRSLCIFDLLSKGSVLSSKGVLMLGTEVRSGTQAPSLEVIHCCRIISKTTLEPRCLQNGLQFVPY